MELRKDFHNSRLKTNKQKEIKHPFSFNCYYRRILRQIPAKKSCIFRFEAVDNSVTENALCHHCFSFSTMFTWKFIFQYGIITTG